MREAFGWPRGPFARAASQVFQLRSALFAGSDGTLLDLTDLAQLWQDAAGTTPAVAPGQPVGLVRDQSGGGRNASQSTSAARPTLARHPRAGRRNLVLQSNSFAAASWNNKPNLSAAGNLLSRTSTSGNAWCGQNASMALGTQFVLSASFKKATIGTLAGLRVQGSYPQMVNVVLDLDTGLIVYQSGSGLTLTSATVAPEGGGWYRVSVVGVVAGSAVTQILVGPARDATGAWEAASDSLVNCYAERVQFEIGTAATAYQQVTTALDVTEPGQPDLWHCIFDAVDDALTVTVPAGGWNSATVAYATDAGVTILTNQTLAAGAWTLPIPLPSRCYAFVAVNRALNANETSLLTNWLNSERGVTT